MNVVTGQQRVESDKRGPSSASLGEEEMPAKLPTEGDIDIWKMVDKQIQE